MIKAGASEATFWHEAKAHNLTEQKICANKVLSLAHTLVKKRNCVTERKKEKVYQQIKNKMNPLKQMKAISA